MRDAKSLKLPCERCKYNTKGTNNIVAKSAIIEDIKIVCPIGSLTNLFSFKVGTTMPSEVVEKINVRKRGLLARLIY